MTNDDAKQDESIIQVIDDGNTLILTSEVIIECCWILKSYYKLSNDRVANAISELLTVAEIETEEQFIGEVLQVYSQKNLDIVDVYLSVKSKNINVPVLTWDSDFKQLDCEWYKPTQVAK